jgi:hypothetical protein
MAVIRRCSCIQTLTPGARLKAVHTGKRETLITEACVAVVSLNGQLSAGRLRSHRIKPLLPPWRMRMPIIAHPRPSLVTADHAKSPTSVRSSHTDLVAVPLVCFWQIDEAVLQRIRTKSANITAMRTMQQLKPHHVCQTVWLALDVQAVRVRAA